MLESMALFLVAYLIVEMFTGGLITNTIGGGVKGAVTSGNTARKEVKVAARTKREKTLAKTGPGGKALVEARQHRRASRAAIGGAARKGFVEGWNRGVQKPTTSGVKRVRNGARRVKQGWLALSMAYALRNAGGDASADSGANTSADPGANPAAAGPQSGSGPTPQTGPAAPPQPAGARGAAGAAAKIGGAIAGAAGANASAAGGGNPAQPTKRKLKDLLGASEPGPQPSSGVPGIDGSTPPNPGAGNSTPNTGGTVSDINNGPTAIAAIQEHMEAVAELMSGLEANGMGVGDMQGVIDAVNGWGEENSDQIQAMVDAARDSDLEAAEPFQEGGSVGGGSGESSGTSAPATAAA